MLDRSLVIFFTKVIIIFDWFLSIKVFIAFRIAYQVKVNGVGQDSAGRINL